MFELWNSRVGSGEPLLLIHGMGSDHTAWKLITPELAKKFEVITIDLPGHGFSSLPGGMRMDAASLGQLIFDHMSRWGYEKFHVVGSSLGGWIALEMAAANPDRVRSLTGLAPAGLWLVPETRRHPISAVSRYMASTTHPIAPHLLRYAWARKIGFAMVSPQWESLPLEICIDAARAMGSSKGYFPAWDAMLGLRFDKEISPSIPITILFGDTDNTLPARYSQERSLVPEHARWITLPQAGHAPMWDSVPAVLEEIHQITSAT
jgi:pimeloyl-ACP methyl ester carboxylesterase